MISWLMEISEETAKWWLGASELLLLISAVVLAVGVIGEWPESDIWRKRLWYKLAKAAVLLGIIGELIGDGGIFEASARLQVIQEDAIQTAQTAAANAIERAARIEQAASWRILSREAFSALREALNEDLGRPLTIGFAVGDPESITFASQLIAAFAGTHWKVTWIGHWYESQLVTGVRVTGSDETGAEFLKRALARVQIPFTSDPVPVPGMYNHPEGGVPDESRLFLYVGTKPPPKF